MGEIFAVLLSFPAVVFTVLTALAMLYLFPGIQTPDPDEATRRLEFLTALPETAALAGMIQSRLDTGRESGSSTRTPSLSIPSPMRTILAVFCHAAQWLSPRA